MTNDQIKWPPSTNSWTNREPSLPQYEKLIHMIRDGYFLATQTEKPLEKPDDANNTDMERAVGHWRHCVGIKYSSLRHGQELAKDTAIRIKTNA